MLSQTWAQNLVRRPRYFPHSKGPLHNLQGRLVGRICDNDSILCFHCACLERSVPRYQEGDHRSGHDALPHCTGWSILQQLVYLPERQCVCNCKRSAHRDRRCARSKPPSTTRYRSNVSRVSARKIGKARNFAVSPATGARPHNPHSRFDSVESRNPPNSGERLQKLGDFQFAASQHGLAVAEQQYVKVVIE